MKIRKVVFTHTGNTKQLNEGDWYIDCYGGYRQAKSDDENCTREIVTREEILEDWKPKEGENYFCIIVNNGTMRISNNNWVGDMTDRNYLETNNCFQSFKIAEQKLSEIKTLLK